MIKAVLVFLLVMVVIGMISNLISPGSVKRAVSRRLLPGKPGKCPHCGRYLIGTGKCDCRKG